MSYSVIGRFLSEGEETPHFTAELLSHGVPIARIESDGRGGCCRMRWAPDASIEARRAASEWMAKQARTLWTQAGHGRPPKALDHMTESAILVVPQMLAGAL